MSGPHPSDHQALGRRIVVTYKTDGDRLPVTQLDDAGRYLGRLPELLIIAETGRPSGDRPPKSAH